MSAKGSAGIPILHNVVLNKLIDKTPPPPSLKFSNMFPTSQAESDEIKWETIYGSGGMTPFVAPGSSAPTVGLDGMSQSGATAAYYKEKSFLDENLLNNLRQPGTVQTAMRSEAMVARQVGKLQYRCQRRREWMIAKMLTANSFSYQLKGGAKFTISYPTPSQNQVTLSGGARWNQTTSTPAVDIFDAKRLLADQYGIAPNRVLMNSATLKLMQFNTSIGDLTKKQAFGDGDLYSNPEKALPIILGLGALDIYDEFYEVPAWIMTPVTAGVNPVIYVDDASDFEVGGRVRLISTLTPYKWEESTAITISAVDKIANTITIAGTIASNYRGGGIDKVIMRKKFVPDNLVLLYSDSIDNQPIAEFIEAPFGMGRNFGRFADTEPSWDPDGLWMRMQDKGLPVLYFPEGIFQLTVI